MTTSTFRSHGEGRRVEVRTRSVGLEGDLGIPRDAGGIVLFAHGSGSSRHSLRNRFVAELLREGHLGTFLIDLLTAEEEAADAATGYLRFDIDLLGDRLVAITDWLLAHPETRALPIGYFGASTGAGAALVAASRRAAAVHAVVSRGGRPDLAWSFLPQVMAPTLLIVGGHDFAVLDLNKKALEALCVEKALAVVPGATHLFEEPGALEEVARLAREWFDHHLAERQEEGG
ncbi:MAG TPA: dienelactone hydrolase family protein [bacterium]|nr:dienelactone hydrolase family protein [bacterium]